MDKQFLEAVFSKQLQHPNFFNGRVLTATDLKKEQEANVTRSRYIGQALGTGVVYGLNVEIVKGQGLSVSGGLAINPKGDPLALTVEEKTISLTLTEQAVASTDSPFAPCGLKGQETLTGIVSTNYYVLAISSASKLSTQLAPSSDVRGSNAPCTSRYEEVGIQFKLIPIIPPELDQALSSEDSKVRSKLAHICLGTAQLLSDATDPVNAQSRYGLEDKLRINGKLTDCDVPLAVFHYQNQTVTFVDVWAVRRPCLPGIRPLTYPTQFPYPTNFLLPFNPFARQEHFISLISPRRSAEALAFFLQFQTQVEDLWFRLGWELPKIEVLSPQLRIEQQENQKTDSLAKKYFEYLPPAGYLPVGNDETKYSEYIENFFGRALPVREFDDPDLMRTLMQESFHRLPMKPEATVDLYRFKGSESAPYILFVRRAPVARLPETSKPSPTPAQTGKLYVSIVTSNGKPFNPSSITSVQAFNQKTKEVYTVKQPWSSTADKFTSRLLLDSLQKQWSNTTKVYGSLNQLLGQDLKAYTTSTATDTVLTSSGAVYQLQLPPGKYTVKANLLALPELTSTAKQVEIRSNRATTIALPIISRIIIDKPGGTFRIPTLPSDPKKNINGVSIRDVYLTPQIPQNRVGWEDLYKPPFPPRPPQPGEVDPPLPDDWVKWNDPNIRLGVEIALTARLRDPSIAIADSQVYVRKRLNPEVISTNFDAFVQTPSGDRFPLILVAADNALRKSATVARLPLPDFDRGTVTQLEAAGLSDLEVFASAPTNLISAVLGQGTNYSKSLLDDVRNSIKESFQEGYMGFAGIDKETNKALVTKYGKDGLIEIANLGKFAELQNTLGGNFGGAFAERFVNEIRSVVPEEAFSLAAVGISLPQRDALKKLEIFTIQQLLDESDDETKRNNLLNNVNGYLTEGNRLEMPQLNEYRQDAAIGMAQGEYLLTPDKNIATLPGVTTKIKETAIPLLAASGILSAKALANQSTQDLEKLVAGKPDSSSLLNILNTLRKSASNYASKAHITFAMGLSGKERTIVEDDLERRQITNIGDILEADAAVWNELGLPQNLIENRNTLKTRFDVIQLETPQVILAQPSVDITPGRFQ